MEARVKLDPRLRGALRDLDGFTHLWLVSTCAASKAGSPRSSRSSTRSRAACSPTRSPRRPNPIALSLVKLLAVKDGALRVRGIDLLDGTPVLDVKPYVPLFDAREGAWAAGSRPPASASTRCAATTATSRAANRLTI